MAVTLKDLATTLADLIWEELEPRIKDAVGSPDPDPDPDPTPGYKSAFYLHLGMQVHNYVDDNPELRKIADTPQAMWLNGSEQDAQTVASRTARAHREGKIPAFVLYAIPNRDGGGHSGGGHADHERYKQWVDSIAAQAQAPAMFIVEPDAIQLPDSLTADRKEALAYACRKLSEAGVAPYIDAGHSAWRGAAEISSRLIGVADHARGLALNVSNFRANDEVAEYGEDIVQRLSAAGILGKTYIIDTARNGNGHHPQNEWCNPSGRALGDDPESYWADAIKPYPNIDAKIWVKPPGESDGNCNGGPGAGQFWVDYAIGLVRNAR